jgi:hypothetical protein
MYWYSHLNLNLLLKQPRLLRKLSRMANTSQVVVLAGVFFAAIFLHVLMMKEAFAVQRPRAKAPSQVAAKVNAAKKASAQTVASTAAIAAPAAGVTGVSASTLKPQQQGLAFSEIIQSLISYTPSRETQVVAGVAGAGAAGANLVSEIKDAVRKEVAGTVRETDATNASLAERCVEPVKPSTPSVASPGLNQGSWFRGPKSVYGVGQMTPPLNVVINSCDYASMQQDMPDMSKYVKKENVYGLA